MTSDGFKAERDAAMERARSWRKMAHIRTAQGFVNLAKSCRAMLQHSVLTARECSRAMRYAKQHGY